jgi:hypothetical protein
MSRISANLVRATVIAGLIGVASSASAQTGPFAGLAGAWSGGGTVELVGGPRERIRCRATYAVSQAGNGLHQTLRCASDSYRFDLSSNILNQAGVLSGTWAETSRNIQGVLIGAAQGGRFQVNVTGPGFIANVSLTTQGDRQSVVITAQSVQSAGATITLTRAR